MKRAILCILVISLGLLLKSCNTTDPPPPPNGEKPTLGLVLEDVSCIEAWIKLKTTNLQLPATITLKQINQASDTKSQILNLNTKDSLLYIDSLLPNQTYKFQSFIQSINQSSNELSVTTLDTTTQNFSFEVLEFGDGFESSYFNDVWIFDENNIWVCGYIYDPSFGRKNIMHWNGSSWESLGIQFNSSGIDGVWALDSSKIYCAAGFIIKYENGTFTEISLGNIGLQNGQRVEKLWGSSENNIYGVGPWGTIVRYDGARWTKIEFDMQWYFYQITGNKETGVGYAVAINQFDDCVVVKLENSAVNIIYQKSQSEIKVASRTITSLGNNLYISGFYQQNLICRLNDRGEIKTIHVLPLALGVRQSFALYSNDIFYSGEENSEVKLVHFNGVNYKIFNIPQIDPDNYGGIHSVKNLAASVGYSNNKAYIIKIRRE